MIRRKLLALIAVFVIPILGSSSAYGHAELSSSNPTNGAVVKVVGKEIILTFNEVVTVNKGGIQLLNSRGKVIASSSKQVGSVVTLKTPGLVRGRYLVRYRIISNDGHIIIESFTFSFGLNTPQSKPLSSYLKEGSNNVPFYLSGSRAGQLGLTLKVEGLSGRVEFKSSTYGAPIVTTLSPNNGSMSGTILLPSAGAWNVLVRVRISEFEERVYTGVLDIKA